MSDRMLTKNFSSREIKCPCCGLDNIDPVFMEKLQKLRDAYGKPMKITSGVRCAVHNAKVGGSPNSQHLGSADKPGYAVDIAMANGADRYKLIKLAMTMFNGVGVYKTWIHVDDRKGPAVCWVG